MTSSIPTSFGPLLRRWRITRALSQERLAGDAEISARHLSCLETSRSAPSRGMVLVLASALDLPLRERNSLLVAAGFAAVYRESPLDGPELAQVRRALDFVLARQEPYPTLVVDRIWNVVRANRGALRMFSLAFGAPVAGLRKVNGLRAIFDPGPIRAAIINWDEVAGSIVARLRLEIAAEPDDHARVALLAELLAQPGVPAHFRKPSTESVQPFLSVHLRVAGVDLRFFTMLATLGTPLDITAQELRIESYFPADAATEAWTRQAEERG